MGFVGLELALLFDSVNCGSLKYSQTCKHEPLSKIGHQKDRTECCGGVLIIEVEII